MLRRRKIAGFGYEEAPFAEADRQIEAIRALLKEERLGLEVERWTAELRDAGERPLPPPVATIGPPGT